jgi:glycosyltransferase involved in cell wall biosynthesis
MQAQVLDDLHGRPRDAQKAPVVRRQGGLGEGKASPEVDFGKEMKILQVNKFFYVRGGSERYYFDLCDLLAAHGHQVSHFSMQHQRNLPSGQEAYFVSSVDLNACHGPAARLKAAARILYSWEARRKIAGVLDAVRPDLVHFHNISRQLSPSIIGEVRRRGVPTVMTLHDLFLVCPAHSFFLNAAPCERCGSGRFWHAVPHRCIDRSAASSALGALEAYFHAWAGFYRGIDRLIAPSRFLMSKVTCLGWPEPRTVHLPYFVPLGPDQSARDEGYVLFAGRTSTEKGVGTLLEAAALARSVKVVIAGEGPELEVFKRRAADLRLANVRFAGYLKGDALEQLLAGARCAVVPSISYENLPLSILEAFARGKPAVAADSGGIAELVEEGKTGFVFRPGDPASLADALGRISADGENRVEMGRAARRRIAADYSPDTHYRRLMAVYQEVTR